MASTDTTRGPSAGTSGQDNVYRADWAVRAPFAQSFYAPRRFQLTARVQF